MGLLFASLIVFVLCMLKQERKFSGCSSTCKSFQDPAGLCCICLEQGFVLCATRCSDPMADPMAMVRPRGCACLATTIALGSSRSCTLLLSSTLVVRLCMYSIRQWPTESRQALWCCSPHIHLFHSFNLYADRMFGTIQQFQKLTAGEQSWGEVGGGVDSGRIVGSGVFITVKSSVKDEVCRPSTCFPFCAHAECARVLSLQSE